MKDIKLTLNTHDLLFENYDLVLIDKEEYLQQKIKIKLMFFYKEWFLDTTKGVDFYGTVFVKNPNINSIDNMFKVSILDIDEIIELLSFTSDYNPSTRKYSINFKVNSIYGEISYQQEFTL